MHNAFKNLKDLLEIIESQNSFQPYKIAVNTGWYGIYSHRYLSTTKSPIEIKLAFEDKIDILESQRF